jgi:hypothetical protein
MSDMLLPQLINHGQPSTVPSSPRIKLPRGANVINANRISWLPVPRCVEFAKHQLGKRPLPVQKKYPLVANGWQLMVVSSLQSIGGGNCQM